MATDNTLVNTTTTIKWYDPKWFVDETHPSSCLHDNCSICGGTGIRKDGLGACIHMISCPCSKCSPRML